MEETRDLEQDISLDEDVGKMEDLSTRIGWVSRRRFEQELEKFNITVPQFMALRCMMGNDHGCNMSELAESSHQVSATMTGIIDRLEDRGLATRERDPHDRRAQRVVLTPAGKEMMEQIRMQKQAWVKQVLASLSPEERRWMISMSQRYLELVEKTLGV